VNVVAEQLPVVPADRPTRGDRVFRTLCVTAAAISLVIVSATIIFMVDESRPAFSASGVWSFFSDSVWNGIVGTFGVFGLLIGTLIIGVIAIVVAVPMAVMMALFINEYAPRRVARALTTMIDLLAALPSLIFGIWGRDAFKNQLFPIARWLSDHLVAIPVFRLSSNSPRLVGSSFIAGVIVGIMAMPIVCSISREVMSRVPKELCEGALALGGTRWAMIRAVVLPFGRSGIVGGTLLGFGRALGETIAVALVIELSYDANFNVLEAGAGSIAALVAIRFGEATQLEKSGLVAAGLALLLMTFTVSLVARRIVTRKAVA
jgi:phosphate transport system permease protein